MVAQVTSHKKGGIWIGCCARQPAEMANSVAWGVKEEEGTVAEEVDITESPSLERSCPWLGKVNLAQDPVGKVSVSHWGVGFGWVSWIGLVLEAGAHDKLGAAREGCHVADVIKVPVTAVCVRKYSHKLGERRHTSI